MNKDEVEWLAKQMMKAEDNKPVKTVDFMKLKFFTMFMSTILFGLMEELGEDRGVAAVEKAKVVMDEIMKESERLKRDPADLWMETLGMKDYTAGEFVANISGSEK